MGRSKFPGKPTKHVNRTRINVLPATSEGIIECCSSVTVKTVAENKQQENNGFNISEAVNSASSSVNTKVSLKRRRLKKKMQTSSKRTIISKLKPSNNTVSCKISKLNHKTRLRGSNNLVGKFVLPTRSVHSSRVIKPNKRFINMDLSDTITLKKRVKPKRLEPIAKTENVEDSPAPVVKSAKMINGRILLRQARLKLHNQPTKDSEGPFSNGTNTSGGGSGTVTCGVCGAVRFYRFIKQARKFNIYSCESCRKFIAKMIKRQSCGKNVKVLTLVCHKGQGMCHVPPVVRSQQMKLIRSGYRSRCPACWLKMCLRSFQMPLSLKNGLMQLLPKNMQSVDMVFSSSLPLLWQVNVSSAKESELPPVSVNQRPVRVVVTKPTHPHLVPTSDIKRQKVDLKGPRVKHVCRSASIVLGQPVATFPKNTIEKKGKTKSTASPLSPALPVLSTTLSPSPCSPLTIPTITIPISPPSTPTPVTVRAVSPKPNKFDSTDNACNDDGKLHKLPLVYSDALFKKDRSQRVPFASSPFSLVNYSNNLAQLDTNIKDKKYMADLPNTISLDFWDHCDLEDVGENGFCLISSQQFPMPAICFWCGSAGREALLHCSLCSEPYHTFCLEENFLTKNYNKDNIWICSRCTSCNVCNLLEKKKYHCTKCSKPYDQECLSLNVNESTNLKSMMCRQCSSCADCGDTDTAKLFGRLVFCEDCFKHRKSGVNCSLCRSICGDGADDKMIGCTKCEKWHHIQCANLPEDFYYLLCLLPASVKYMCSECSKKSTPMWRKLVNAELKTRLKHILKVLCKNKLVKNLLPLRRYPMCDSVNLETKSNDNYSDLKIRRTLRILRIKRGLNSNKYNSVGIFYSELEDFLSYYQSDQLINICRSIFKTVFPWLNFTQYKSFTQKKTTNIEDTFLDEQINDEDEEINDQIECTSIDSRYCSFCKSIGDGLSHLESRLLYCGQNEWVHINCALWSTDVYEEIDGSLQNVHIALSKSRYVRCSNCKQKGANVGCHFKGCTEIFHFMCARTTKCHFMEDNTVFCSTHEIPKNTKTIVTPGAFHILRPVFVEVNDYKKEQFAQIDKVNVMVGSLCITSLGKINSLLSDNVEALLPTGYVCSRLYWSTVEPWRLVPYKISTSVLNATVNQLQLDKSFTVDHSLPKAVVERKLKEIVTWSKEIEKKKTETTEFDDDEEPQTGADLLSPEITNAIFEELPHELLDGISVQDIFPKLMSYEDFVNVDYKTDTSNNSDSLNIDGKKSDDIESYSSDSPVLGKNKNQQRSCSLTLSCKLDNTFSPVIKKRKSSPRENNLFFKLLQVDGAFDDSSSESEGPISYENKWQQATNIEEPVTCERCQCTYRTQASYKRHLDSCEVICSSESDSEVIQEYDSNMETFVTQNEIIQPPTAELVVNTTEIQRSFESYQNEIHTSVLNTQTFVSSKSTSEFISVPQNSVVQPELTTCNVAALETESINNNEAYAVRHSTVSITEPVIPTNQQYCLNSSVPLCVNQPISLQTTPSVINTNLNQTITGIEFQANPTVTLQPIQYSTTNVPLLNMTSQNPNIINSVVTNVSPNRWIKPSTVEQIKTLKKVPRRSIAVRRNIVTENDIISPQSVIVQHVPSTNFVPTFVDNFQQASNQNVQYVATFTPQITTNSQPMMQFQPDNNLISLVPGIQPTMIIQQPRVIENQLYVDSNGSLSWTPPVQPMYYGFETIVQNTVMQSQQFLPSTVPGVLTANSSYSTTTQVFQTSKLEPVIDLSANSFVLVNPSINTAPVVELANSSQMHQTLVTPHNDICKVNPYQKISTINQPTTIIANSASITLPTAPLVPEPKIPTNIVTPTPKIINPSRPMNRVLPMQNVKDVNKVQTVQTLTTEKHELVLKDLNTTVLSQSIENVPQTENTNPKTSQNFNKDCKTYKNTFITRSSPVQIAPLKPIKSNVQKPVPILSTSDKQNQPPEKTEKKVVLETTKPIVPEKKEIENNAPLILYTIETQDGFKYSSTSIADLWTKVFEAVQSARAAHNMPLLPSDSSNLMNSLNIMGLKASGLKFLLEQLPGATKCSKYRPTFSFPSRLIDLDEDLVGHDCGSVRCASHSKSNEPYDMFGWLASKHRKPEQSLISSELIPRRGSVNNLPMAMRFRHLKLTSKYSVGVYRSKIHRRGLFCLRDFEAGEMVIEYAGEVIRSVLTDKREKLYNSKGIGCYMFRVDDNLVVDATMKGNAARFINHSCDPNCYSKVVEILGHKHIIIFALRRIICGEELTYDYKFPIEEDKIPCTCGTRRCRKFLN